MLNNIDGKQVYMMTAKDLLLFLDAFYTKIKAERDIKEDEWIDATQAKSLLKLSTTSLYKLRVGGHIKFSQYGKTILYSRSSIMEFISNNTKDTFA